MTTHAAKADEHVDVLIVGARCAGSATALALARRDRSVLVLDGASFPSDTLSTHLFFPSHVAELERLGVHSAIDRLGAPRHHHASIWAAGHLVTGPFSATDGFDYGTCLRRPGLDAALVDATRASGAEVREQTRVTELLRDGSGRVTGVGWRDRSGATGSVTASLVVGADGRRSFVADQVRARKHHEWANRRLMAFAYYRDVHGDQRGVPQQWRLGRELGTVFPCDDGLSVVLLMPPAERAEEFRADPVTAFETTVAGIAPMAARLEGCTRETKIRMSYQHPSYFRHSAGRGWALVGDAGHFKDPVTAQGIRDALRFGRLLGERVAPYLDAPERLDPAIVEWEQERDRQCLDMYQWANGLGLADDVSPLEAAAYHWFAERPERAAELLDVFSRSRSSREVFRPRRLAGWIHDAIRDPAIDNRVLWSSIRRELRRERVRHAERRTFAATRAAPEPAGGGQR